MTFALRVFVIVAGLLVVGGGCGKGVGIPTFVPQKAAPPSKTLAVKPVAEPAELPQPADLPTGEAILPEESSDPVPAVETPVGEPAPIAADLKGVLYSDSFADVKGSIKRKVNGALQSEGPANLRTIYFFMPMPAEGLTMRAHEDPATNGPDGQPGVLALTWEEIPPVLQYSGFVYLGGPASPGRMTLPPLKLARTAADLEGLRLKFRFRGINAASDTPVQFKVDCRLEPQLPDSYAKRLDFGPLVATDEWNTIDVALIDGKNREAFLRTMTDEQAPHFKVVFAQTGAIAGYRAGDTLLIDDVTITSGTAP